MKLFLISKHQLTKAISRIPSVFIAGILLLLSVMVPGSAVFAASQTPSIQAQITSLSVEDKNDFVLEPGKIEVNVNPGEIVTKYISVTSRVKENTRFLVTTEDFIGSRSEQQPVLLLGKEKSPYSFKDSLVPAETNFSLKFGDRITMPIQIVVPKDAQPGGYYASVIISNEPQVTADIAQVNPGQVRVISRLGVLFFIRVNGPVNESGHVEDFRIASPQTVYSKSPTDFQILFNNTGTVHLIPYGEVHIRNLLGNEISELPVDAYFALPNSLRYRDVVWDDNTFRIGRYTATLLLHRGYGTDIDTRVIAFWIIPWKTVLPVAFVILVVLIFMYLFFSRFEMRRKK